MTVAHHDDWDYARYALLPEDGQRHEIIAGAHYVTPSPRTRHQRVLVRLVSWLHRFVEERGDGAVFAAPFDVVLSDHDVVQPDLLYISGARLEILTELHVRGAPDLVVEILSPGNRSYDTKTKRSLYASYEVAEYWVIDPNGQSVTVLTRPADGAFEVEARFEAASADRLMSEVLPAIDLDLVALFR